MSPKPAIWSQFGSPVGNLSEMDVDVLSESQMDYEVVKKPVFAQYFENGQIKYFEVPERFLTARVDKHPTDPCAYLGHVGDNYNVIQNAELRDFAVSLADTGNAQFERAGTFRNGKAAWMLARVDGDFCVRNDPLYPYLMLVTSHDGSLPFMSILTMVRARCQNMISAAMNKCKYRYSIRHTESASWKIDEANKAMKHGTAYAECLRKELEKMSQDLMDKNFVEGFLAAVIRGEKFKKNKAGMTVKTQAEKTREELKGLIWGGQIGGDDEALFRDGKPTAYGMYMAYTQFDETERVVRCHEHEDGTKKTETEARFDSIMFGGMYRNRDVVFNLLMRRNELKGNAEKMAEVVMASGVAD
jgi:phage/plasmid-like protein (TIGR03299 family)